VIKSRSISISTHLHLSLSCLTDVILAVSAGRSPDEAVGNWNGNLNLNHS
jgi:hypothetical protein